MNAEGNSGTVAKPLKEDCDLLAQYKLLQSANMFDEELDGSYFDNVHDS